MLTANANAIADAVESGDGISLATHFQERKALAEDDISVWLAREIALDPRLSYDVQTKQAPFWSGTLKRGLAAFFKNDRERALILAEEAAVTPQGEEMAVLPALWLAHLELWPPKVESFGKFVSLREKGIARMDGLRAAYPDDRLVMSLAAQARIINGEILEGIGILDDLADEAPLDPVLTASADRLAKWRPAMDEGAIIEIASLPPLPENRPDFVFGDLQRLDRTALYFDPIYAEALDLTALPPLHKMAAVDNKAMIERVLPTVMDLDQAAPRGGAAYSATHLAAELGNVAAVEAFSNHGANIDLAADSVAELQSLAEGLGGKRNCRRHSAPGRVPAQPARPGESLGRPRC